MIFTSRHGLTFETGKIELEVPRDRLSTFDPQLIAKYQRRFPGFDEKIVSMYARGMSTREIQGHLRDLYGVDVSADLVSAVTDAALDEIAEWQNRPLERLYALVFFDAIRVKVRDEGMVRNKAVYVALGVRPDELLPAPYFHVVYTLPGPIADIAYQNKAVIYDILFKASAETMITIAADPKHLGARIGITSVLHTWGSAMTHHPHVHMIVPGGGLDRLSTELLLGRPRAVTAVPTPGLADVDRGP